MFLMNIGLLSGQSGLANPESIIPFNGNYLVSNIGEKLDAELDGDGFIAMVDSKGNVIERNVFIKSKIQLNAPKGMALVDEMLYVSDIQRIVGYNLKDRKTSIIIDLSSEALFLNDIAAQDEETLLVTDTFKNTVFKVSLSTQSIEQIYSEIGGANGVAVEDGDVYIVGTGENLNAQGQLFQINNSGVVKNIPNSPIGILDGVQKISDDKLLVTDWVDLKGGEGKFYLYDTEIGTYEVSSVKKVSPADFFYDETNNKVLVPQTLRNRILVYDLEELFDASSNGNLFHYGFIDSFLGGMYDGGLTYRELLDHGGFGLGAPDKLDGEITVLEGKAYQTKASGNTTEVKDSDKTSYAFVTQFSKNFGFPLKNLTTKEELEKTLDKQLTNANGMYAIKISGVFKKLKTRAFPPVKNKPYPELTSMLQNQAFFEYENIEGTLVGFRLPVYLNSVNVPGYHFHFISEDKSKGGHVLELNISEANIEIDILDSYTVQIPKSEDFVKFDFNKDRRDDVKSAESGVKED